MLPGADSSPRAASVAAGAASVAAQGGSVAAQWPPTARLLAEAPVYPLAQQVGMAVVAGVLLDHVHQQLA